MTVRAPSLSPSLVYQPVIKARARLSIGLAPDRSCEVPIDHVPHFLAKRAVTAVEYSGLRLHTIASRTSLSREGFSNIHAV